MVIIILIVILILIVMITIKILLTITKMIVYPIWSRSVPSRLFPDRHLQVHRRNRS